MYIYIIYIYIHIYIYIYRASAGKREINATSLALRWHSRLCTTRGEPGLRG